MAPAETYPGVSHGGFLCASHLIELGHRRIAFTMTHDSTRWQGYLAAVAEAEHDGIEVVTDNVDSSMIEGWMSVTGATGDYFRRPDAPTAVCIWNDSKAMELMRVLRREGVSVPGDLSVTGYDNLPDGASFEPGITTVDTDITQQLRAALRLLTQETVPPAATEVILSPQLIARTSTGVVR